MSTTNAVDKTAITRGNELRLDTILLGLQSSALPQGTTLVIRGVTTTIPDLITKVTNAVAPLKALRSDRAAVVASRKVVQDAEPATVLLTGDIRVALQGFLGANNPELAQFGFKAKKKPTPLTVEQKAAATLKRAQTRAKLHTMGSRQKAALKAAPAAPTTPTAPPAANGNAKP